MAVYDMITDSNGNQVKAAPYYVDGSGNKVEVGSGMIVNNSSTADKNEN